MALEQENLALQGQAAAKRKAQGEAAGSQATPQSAARTAPLQGEVASPSGDDGGVAREDATQREEAAQKAAPKRRAVRRRKAALPGEAEALWAAVMRDETAPLKDRMHAAELCAKAQEARRAAQPAADVGRLDEVLLALWGCRAGEMEG